MNIIWIMSLWILCVVDSAETNGEDNQETDEVVTAEDHLDGTTMLVSEWSANLREASLEIMRAGEERFLARREENRRLSEEMTETDDIMEAEVHLDGTSTVVRSSENYAARSLSSPELEEQRRLAAEKEERRRLGGGMHVYVRDTSSGKTYAVDVGPEATLKDLRSGLRFNTDTGTFTYGGRPLHDLDILSDKGVAAETTVEFVLSFPLYYGDPHKIDKAIDLLMKHEGAQAAVILYFNTDETKGNWIAVIDGGRKQPDGRITGASSIWDRTSSHSVNGGVADMEDDPILQMVSERFKTRSGTRRSPAFTDPN